MHAKWSTNKKVAVAAAVTIPVAIGTAAYLLNRRAANGAVAQSPVNRRKPRVRAR